MTKTHDLGNGWLADHSCDDNGTEEMTVRNVDTGIWFDLPDESVKTLRKIFKSHT